MERLSRKSGRLTPPLLALALLRPTLAKASPSLPILPANRPGSPECEGLAEVRAENGALHLEMEALRRDNEALRRDNDNLHAVMKTLAIKESPQPSGTGPQHDRQLAHSIEHYSPPVAPPLLPPLPPSPPWPPAPSGMNLVATTEDLRHAINATAPGHPLALYLPEGVVFPLNGEPLTIGPISLLLQSDGAGATLDAQRLSRVFDIAMGCQLRVVGLTLANGWHDTYGGTVMMLFMNSIVLSRCMLVNSSALISGGGIAMSHGSLVLTDGTQIVNARARFRDGNGGGIVVFQGDVTINGGSVIRGCTAYWAGGLSLAGAATVLITGKSRFESCSGTGNAKGTGFSGAFNSIDGVITINGGCTFENCTSGQGGVFTTAGNARVHIDDCTFTGNSVESGGGVMNVIGGEVVVANSRLLNSYARADGGAIRVDQSAVLYLRNCVISNSFSEFIGGAVALHGGMLIISACRIDSSIARSKGGMACVAKGTLLIHNGTVITNSFAGGYQASGRGGSIAATGLAIVTVHSSRISVSYAQLGGGCFHLDNVAQLNLSYAIVEGCTVGAAGTGAVAQTQSGSVAGSLLIATFTEFRQHQCDKPIISSPDVTAFQLLLRGTITFTPLFMCNRTALASAAAFPVVIPKSCGEQYRDLQGAPWGVCNLASASACSSKPVAGTVLHSLTCSCPGGAFENPAIEDQVMAPYLPTAGCIAPLTLKQILVTDENVTVALARPERVSQSVNVTMRLEGIEGPANWTLLNAYNVTRRSPWLQLPHVAGVLAKRGQLQQPNVAGGLTDFLIPVHISAAGLAERPMPYTELLHIQVVAQLGDRASTMRTLPLHVSLSVEARTSFVVWGRIQGINLCQRDATNASRPLLVDVSASPLDVHFTACDSDSLPVSHRLPTPADSRRFKTYIETPHLTSSAQSASVIYSGEGVYSVSLSLAFHGPFALHLELGDQHALTRDGTSQCSAEKIAAATGVCVCPKDTEPAGSFADTCQPCMEGYYKLNEGNEMCQRKPMKVWPVAVAAAGGVLFVVLVFALIQWSERRRRERDMQLEQEFMAVT